MVVKAVKNIRVKVMVKMKNSGVIVMKPILRFVIYIVLAIYASFGFAADVFHAGSISSNEQWAGTDIHVITSDVVVQSGVTLTVDPGAIVKFQSNTNLDVSGTLLSAGTEVDKIIFTSFNDDVGGDTNGAVTAPAAGDWGSINFFSGSDSSNVDHTEFRWGGGASSGMLYVTYSYPTIQNALVEHSVSDGIHLNQGDSFPQIISSQISNNAGYGIYISSTNPDIDGNTISQNGIDGIAVIGTGKPLIKNNVIESNVNGWGVRFISSVLAPPIANNTIRLNKYAIRVPLASLPIDSDGNLIASNLLNHIEVLGVYPATRSLVLSHKEVYYFSDQSNSSSYSLTINPGVIIKFGSYGGFSASGNVNAFGTDSEKIIITSVKDDIGGDTDEIAATASSGDWQYFKMGSLNRTTNLSHAEVRYGGQSSQCALVLGGSYNEVSNSLITSNYCGIRAEVNSYTFSTLISNNTISQSNSAGVDATGTYNVNINIISNTIDQNGYGVKYDYKTSVDGNIISNNGTAIRAITSSSIPRNNTIENNGGGMTVPFRALPSKEDGNIYINNLYSDVYLDSMSQYAYLANRVVTLEEGVKYKFSGEPRVSSGGVLVMEPGVTIKAFGSARLNVDYGRIVANGTPEKPVIFTTVKDHSDGSWFAWGTQTEVARNGDWKGLYFSSTADSDASLLRYAQIRYAGAGGLAALDLNTSVTVENSTISNSATSGIRINDASPLITGNSVWGNSGSGIIIEGTSTPTITLNHITTNILDGITIESGANATVNSNQIYMNREYGLRNNGIDLIDATDNWWGDSDILGAGPYHWQSNTSGTGDEVSDNVIYSPYKDTVGTEISYINFNANGDITDGSVAPPTVYQGGRSNAWDVSERPDRTVANDPAFVGLSYTGLDASKTYKARVSYFNGDSTRKSLQSLTDGAGAIIHDVREIWANASPVQYEFSIPATTTLDLKFVRDSVTPSPYTDAVVSEIWLLEDISNNGAPKLIAAEFNDVDGLGTLSGGDEYYFRFSTPMDATLPVADTNLSPEGKSYGTSSLVSWADPQTLIVTVSSDLTITGTELVTVSGMQDTNLTTVTGSQRLKLIDTIAPAMTSIVWEDVDVDTRLSVGDQYVFHFNEAMDKNTLVTANVSGKKANDRLPPAGGLSYGNVNNLSWNLLDSKSVTVTVTNGYTILGDESVSVSAGVTDAAGNGATGAGFLTGRDLNAPLITGVALDDINASGLPDIGDRFVFSFNEPMDTSSLKGDTDANTRMELTPSAIYGSSNIITWNPEGTAVSIYLTEGTNISGTETVNPASAVTDVMGNPVANTIELDLIDDVAPELVSAQGSVPSPVPLAASYTVTAQFNGTMDINYVPVITISSTSGPDPSVSTTGGSWSATNYTNDTYTTPVITLSIDMIGPLSVNVSSGQDLTANVMTDVTGAHEFYIQPTTPAILSHFIDPEINYQTNNSVSMTGTRDPNTSISINGLKYISLGSGDWVLDTYLNEGVSVWNISASDAANNVSDIVKVTFDVDTIPPVIDSITPDNGSATNVAPSTITIAYTETGRGLDLSGSTLVVKKGVPISGNWSDTGNLLTFTPQFPLIEGTYQIDVQLLDNANHTSSYAISQFAIDHTPPAAPAIDTIIPEVTNINSLTVTGTKEANTSIWLNGSSEVVLDGLTNWSYAVPLTVGLNTLSFTAKDAALNESLPTTASITYDNTAPQAITDQLSAEGAGDGISVVLEWTNYDEGTIGGNDVASYKAYYHTDYFSDITNSGTLLGFVQGGTQTYTATGLTRDTLYYFAVVPIDTQGNYDPIVAAVSATTLDVTAPEEVTDVSVGSTETSVTISWLASTDSHGDLASYNFYIDTDQNFINNPTPTSLLSTITSHQITGLTAAAQYWIRISTVDDSGNESTGVKSMAVTLLQNPTGLVTYPLDSMADINWTGVTPSSLVKHYAVYVLASDIGITDVTTMTLALTTSTTSARLAGLNNDTIYQVAVTTINRSDGESEVATSVGVTPVADTQGPVIANLQFNDAALAEDSTVTRPDDITMVLEDPAGINRVEFHVDGTLLGIDANGADGYSMYWNLYDYSDGPHTLAVTAYDNLANSSTTTPSPLNLTVSLNAPTFPSITSPVTGYQTNQPQVEVRGTAQAGADISIYKDGVTLIPGPISTDAGGNFAVSVPLLEDDNILQAKASNRGGPSALSASITVNRDSSVPEAPVGTLAKSKPAGLIQLSWTDSQDKRVAGYNVYRAATSFNAKAEALKVNSALLTGASYPDIPATDGTYYYRVEAINDLGTASELSVQVSGVADSQLPQALSIDYAHTGSFDPGSGRMSSGQVNVTVNVSEVLQAIPFLSITPAGGIPMIVDLAKQDELTFSGNFTISATTPSGTAWAALSARDKVGNRGTDVLVGATILIDTDGPTVTSLLLTPAAPIKTDTTYPETITFDAILNEAVKDGTEPQFSYVLSGSGRSSEPVTNLVKTAALTYRGSFILPSDAGAIGGTNVAENLTLEISALDDLDNTGDKITAPSQFQVYQGNLPPLDIPANFSGKVLPGAQIKLTWDAVEGAADYQIYRQAPGEGGLTDHARTSGALEFTETTDTDGVYSYTGASVRTANGEDAISGETSPVVDLNTDRVAPDAPINLALEVVGAGVNATWNEPEGNIENLSYNVHRSTVDMGSIVSDLTKIQTGVVMDAGVLSYIDTQAIETKPYYAVTAVDEAGNESLPSASAYQNVSLLPVASLIAEKIDDNLPELTWTHNSISVDGYDVLIGETDPVKINSTLWTSTSLTDSGYTGDTRHYTVKAVINDNRSPGRTVVLPQLITSLNENSTVNRGVMNQLDYTVVNQGTAPVTGIVLKATVDTTGGAYEHSSATFSLLAGESLAVPVVVGGYNDLQDISSLVTRVEATAVTGEKASIVTNSQVLVNDRVLVLGVESRNLVRGTNGEFRFTLDNTSAVETEIITALNSGVNSTNDVRLQLEDSEGNVLASQAFLQATGNSVVTLSNSVTVARLPVGERFISDWFTVPIPASAPDRVVAKLVIDHFHYHLNKTEAISIQGMSTTQDVILVDTPYTGTVSNALPSSSYGGVPVVIAGQALDRLTSLPVAQVPLKLIISVKGFERSAEVHTDFNGDFSYTFEPLANEGGIYTVSVTHPDEISRPGQGQFTINKVLIQPNILKLYAPFDVPQALDVITASTSEGTTATNLRLDYVAGDQTDAVFPAGVNVVLPDTGIDLLPQMTGKLPFTISAVDTADPTGQIVLRVLSDESNLEPLAYVTLDYTFSQAQPALFFSPAIVQTGAAQDSKVTDTVTLENKGLAELTDVAVALVNPDVDGTPAPSWIYLLSATEQGTMAVGDQREIQIQASPTTSVSTGNYSFLLRVTSSNHDTVDINVVVAVTLTGEGNVIFRISDIYTNTQIPDGGGARYQGVNGAQIKVQNEEVLTVNFTQSTDSDGETTFIDLPTGRYIYRVSAPDHEDATGRFSIKAGVTHSEPVFLDYNLVTIEWSVSEITITDSYQITLQAVYETAVPAAVVVFEPASITLPDMSPGDVFNGEFTLTNHGLIRADNVNMTYPSTDEYFEYEFLVDPPASIDANQVVVLPFRVVALKSLDPTGTSGTGGGCSGYGNGVSADFSYECANEEVTTGQASAGFTTEQSVSCSTGGGGGGGSAWGGVQIFAGSLGGSGQGFSLAPSTSLSGTSCPKSCDGSCEGNSVSNGGGEGSCQ